MRNGEAGSPWPSPPAPHCLVAACRPINQLEGGHFWGLPSLLGIVCLSGKCKGGSPLPFLPFQRPLAIPTPGCRTAEGVPCPAWELYGWSDFTHPSTPDTSSRQYQCAIRAFFRHRPKELPIVRGSLCTHSRSSTRLIRPLHVVLQTLNARVANLKKNKM
ncbi:hypothetical protein F5Y15DRAFT_322834 [Xylariaceae sp. FL0016]|nr:hypothetical protein F5Y15DRAFT_322834 [Xylariaceae sp. FL0016]